MKGIIKTNIVLDLSDDIEQMSGSLMNSFTNMAFYTPLSSDLNNLFLIAQVFSHIDQWYNYSLYAMGKHRVRTLTIRKSEGWTNEFFVKKWGESKIIIEDRLNDYRDMILVQNYLTGNIQFTFHYQVSKKKQQQLKAKCKAKTFVYLMSDISNGYTKIGCSKDPQYRESTLQAEKPSIELIFHREGSYDLEKQLHRYFKKKRLRGEWFDLSKEEIEKAINLIQAYKPTK